MFLIVIDEVFVHRCGTSLLIYDLMYFQSKCVYIVIILYDLQYMYNVLFFNNRIGTDSDLRPTPVTPGGDRPVVGGQLTAFRPVGNQMAGIQDALANLSDIVNQTEASYFGPTGDVDSTSEINQESHTTVNLGELVNRTVSSSYSGPNGDVEATSIKNQERNTIATSNSIHSEPHDQPSTASAAQMNADRVSPSAENRKGSAVVQEMTADQKAMLEAYGGTLIKAEIKEEPLDSVNMDIHI